VLQVGPSLADGCPLATPHRQQMGVASASCCVSDASDDNCRARALLSPTAEVGGVGQVAYNVASLKTTQAAAALAAYRCACTAVCCRDC